MYEEIEEIAVKDPFLEKQWIDWSEANDISKLTAPTDEELREAVIKDLQYASQMTVEEYTLFQKWCEIQERYPTKEVSTLFGDELQMDKNEEMFIKGIKDNIWIPKSPEDYLELQPELIYTKDAEIS